ncbi:MAG: adenosylmethionine--8-amino-7-oxononanoate transaminase [Verrucomicrobiales bacterium]
MNTRELQELDKRHLWHPFTQMRDWCASEHEPLVLARGKGARLWDSEGREYIDGNSSIWTNIHGHNHPAINAAIREQLEKVGHASFLGFTNEPAIKLAAALTSHFPPDTLTRVFYSDDGSTAVECALKMALQFWQLAGQPQRREFIAFDRAYHGDTLGAASLGGISLFHDRFAGLGVPAHHVRDVATLDSLPPGKRKKIAAIAIEPLVQGAAGMQLWPRGMLRQLRGWCDQHDILLIVDEVMTGFGRTGTMFACQQENVTPDFLCLAKGLTGGYLPLGATLTTDRIFGAFLGTTDEQKTFFYGHSYSGNPLGCAAALASLRIFEGENVLEQLLPKISLFSTLLAELKSAVPDHIGEIRRCGLIAGIDLVKDVSTGELFDPREQTGASVCLAAREFGLLTRPIRDTIILMPPLCVMDAELGIAVEAVKRGIEYAVR